MKNIILNIKRCIARKLVKNCLYIPDGCTLKIEKNKEFKDVIIDGNLELSLHQYRCNITGKIMLHDPKNDICLKK